MLYIFQNLKRGLKAQHNFILLLELKNKIQLKS